jgi:metal-responsive CopG/Arc/MetJ family transcriptional regulator
MTQAKTGISVDETVMQDVEKLVATGKYRNKSHFFEMAARKLLEEEKKVKSHE